LTFNCSCNTPYVGDGYFCNLPPTSSSAGVVGEGSSTAGSPPLYFSSSSAVPVFSSTGGAGSGDCQPATGDQSEGGCVVGWTDAPDCCNRLSDQTPTVAGNVNGSQLVLTATAEPIPAPAYAYTLGLSPTRTPPAPGVCMPAVSVTTLGAAWTVTASFDLGTLSTCLSTTSSASGLVFQGYAVLGINYPRWNAFVGVFFFHLTVEVSNTTQASTRFVLTPSSDGPPVDVHIDIQSLFYRCGDSQCATINPNFFVDGGSVVTYRLVLQAGPYSALGHVVSLILLLEGGSGAPLYQLTTFTWVQSQLNVTIFLTVPPSTTLPAGVTYLHVIAGLQFSGLSFVTAPVLLHSRFDVANGVNSALRRAMFLAQNDRGQPRRAMLLGQTSSQDQSADQQIRFQLNDPTQRSGAELAGVTWTFVALVIIAPMWF